MSTKGRGSFEIAWHGLTIFFIGLAIYVSPVHAQKATKTLSGDVKPKGDSLRVGTENSVADLAGGSIGNSPNSVNSTTDSAMDSVPRSKKTSGNRRLVSIPYPQRSLYVSKGLLAGIGIGKFQSEQDPHSQFQWQGEATFFYTPWFSGGGSGKIIAGQPTDSVDQVRNRYMLVARLHAAGRTTAAFAGFQAGLDNEVLHLGQSDSLDQLPNFSNTPNERTLPTIAFEAGMGWKPISWLGWTAGGMLESVWRSPFNVRVSGGAAIDLMDFWPKVNDVVSALYFSAEYQHGFLLAERGDAGLPFERAFVIGFGLAF